MWEIKYTKQADKDKRKLREAGLDRKAKSLVETIRTTPFARTNDFEPLVGNLKGAFSRRISLHHRFVYEVVAGPHKKDGKRYEGYVKIISMWTHCEGSRR